MEEYDVIIIGGGPGGYHAAHLLSGKGKKVMLVEREALGGTCLNWGCIPTKTLLNLAKQYSYSTELKDMGLIGDLHYHHDIAMKWKNRVVDILRSGVGSMMKKDKVNVVQGVAAFKDIKTDKKIISVRKEDSTQDYIAKHLIIACGVESFIPPISGIESANFMTSREILDIKEVPKKLTVIGGGVIGIEMAAIFSQLGSKVTVLEFLPEILPMMDAEGVAILKKGLMDLQDIDVFCKAKVNKVEKNLLSFENADGNLEKIDFDALLVSTGRSTDLTKFVGAGLSTSNTGIIVDDRMKTNIPNVYAIGDVVGTFQLAHVAYRMAEVAVDTIVGAHSNGRPSKMRYNAVPMVIYTYPEMASCGLTESQAREKGYVPVVASLPISINGRVIAEHGIKSKGYCKIVADEQSGKVLGLHIVSPMASEIIAIASIIIDADLRIKELVDIIFPHPTVGEIIHNVSLMLDHKLNTR